MDPLPLRRVSVDRRSGRMSFAMDSLHLLEHELHLASIRKDSLSGVTHSLLQLLLRLFSSDPACRRNHFFSFTETSTDYSVILDAQLLEILRPEGANGKIAVAEGKWRPLVMEVGALGSFTGISKIAASVIAPLADSNVSVFCLSTNQDDYVLVREEDLERALACLSKRFKLVCGSERKADIALVEAMERKSGQLDSPIRLKSHCSAPAPRPLVHPYVCSNNKFSICSIVPKALPSVGVLLLELMLYNKRLETEDVFFSLSVIDEDISMVVDSRDLERFPEEALYFSEGSWRMIRIGEGSLDLDECGIVAQVSAPLAQAEISTYYICTYYTDHTLLLNYSDWVRAFQRYLLQGSMVPEESMEHALQLLNDRLVAKTCSGLKASDSVLESSPAVAPIS